MNGEWLGSRAIRVNWANQKTQTGGSRTLSMPGSAGGFGSNTPLTFEQIAAQTPEYNTTVYVGNLIPYTTQADLIPLFQNYGYIVEIRMQADRGFAFVKLDTHANAALAIMSLQNQQHLIHGRPIKCSWGKDRQTDAPGNYMVGVSFCSTHAHPRCTRPTIHTTPATVAFRGSLVHPPRRLTRTARAHGTRMPRPTTSRAVGAASTVVRRRSKSQTNDRRGRRPPASPSANPSPGPPGVS